jgi:hypothetical protein
VPCKSPTALARSERFVFVGSGTERELTAFEMVGDALVHVWSCPTGGQVTWLCVALQDAVLIAACTGTGSNELLPVDIRANRPEDWKFGTARAHDTKSAESAKSVGVDRVDRDQSSKPYVFPYDVAYADGRLFVTEWNAPFLRIMDVAMDPTAAAAPITEDQRPLITLRPITVVHAPVGAQGAFPVAVLHTSTEGVRVSLGSRMRRPSQS